MTWYILLNKPSPESIYFFLLQPHPVFQDMLKQPQTDDDRLVYRNIPKLQNLKLSHVRCIFSITCACVHRLSPTPLMAIDYFSGHSIWCQFLRCVHGLLWPDQRALLHTSTSLNEVLWEFSHAFLFSSADNPK